MGALSHTWFTSRTCLAYPDSSAETLPSELLTSKHPMTEELSDPKLNHLFAAMAATDAVYGHIVRAWRGLANHAVCSTAIARGVCHRGR